MGFNWAFKGLNLPVKTAKNLTHVVDIIICEHGTYLLMNYVDLNTNGLSSDFTRH